MSTLDCGPQKGSPDPSNPWFWGVFLLPFCSFPTFMRVPQKAKPCFFVGLPCVLREKTSWNGNRARRLYTELLLPIPTHARPITQWMQLFCSKLEASCLQSSFLRTSVLFSILLTIGAFLLTIGAFLLTIGALLLTMGNCV